MAKPFEKMIKGELEEATANTPGLQEKVDALAVTKSRKNGPTNADYVAVLEADAEATEKAKASVSAEKEVITESDPIEDEAVKQEMIEEMSADLNTLIPVIVTDHDTSISVEEDVEGRTVGIRWGNPVIGMSTTNVPIHGRMQYLPKGAVMRLRKISLASHVQDAAGKEKSHRDRKRFSVADTTGWSESEFEAHASEQALKKI